MNAESSATEAIHALVATIEHAQQNELVDEFMAVIHPDATFVLGAGRRLFGRDAIAEQTRAALPGSMTHSKATFTVEDIRFLRPDVAVASVRLDHVDHDGRLVTDRPSGLPTYVVVMDESGAWKLAAGQNTYISQR